MYPNPLISKLGYPSDARLVIFHADDVGLCHGSNQAFLDLSAADILKTGSIMVPCPWSPEILQVCAANPALDVGVHLTLTSEWPAYRWGPLTTRDPVSGLLDGAGYLWPQVGDVQAHLKVDAAVIEMRAQIERARSAGVDFTHLDTHMGVAVQPELIMHYIQLGFAYRVPVLLSRQLSNYIRSLNFPIPDEAAWQQFILQIEAQGMPLVDWFCITPGYDKQYGEGGRAELYETILHNLPPGVTYFSLHPNAPGDIETIDPENAHWRTFEYEYLQSRRLQTFLAEEQIIPIGYREIREVMRSGLF